MSRVIGSIPITRKATTTRTTIRLNMDYVILCKAFNEEQLVLLDNLLQANNITLASSVEINLHTGEVSIDEPP